MFHGPPSGATVARACSLAVLLCVYTPVSAQEVTASSDGTVSVSGSDVPLGAMLRALAVVSPFQKLIIDPSVEDRPTTVSLEHVSVVQAVTAILQSAGVDYVIVGPTRVFAGDRKFVGERLRAARDSESEATNQGPALGSSIADEKISDALIDEPTDAGSRDQASGQAEREASIQELQRVLLVPTPSAPRAGSIIELPFPGPDGAPLTTVMPPQGTPIVLPFPGGLAPTVSPATPIRPAPAGSIDPELQGLIEALSPKPGRVR